VQFNKLFYSKNPIQHSKQSYSRLAGLTLIEILVSLGIVSLIAITVGYFTLPLNLTRKSNVETQALTIARTYMEIVKGRWSDINDTGYTTMTGLPTVSEIGNAAVTDIKIPVGWTLVVNSADWNLGPPVGTVDSLRTVKVIVQPTPITDTSLAVTLSTQIIKPN
jgi:type II secretory pathway pseudopilin PulG